MNKKTDFLSMLKKNERFTYNDYCCKNVAQTCRNKYIQKII